MSTDNVTNCTIAPKEYWPLPQLSGELSKSFRYTTGYNTSCSETPMKPPPPAKTLSPDPPLSPEPQFSPEPPLSGCSLEELEAQITELAGQLNAANYRWLAPDKSCGAGSRSSRSSASSQFDSNWR